MMKKNGNETSQTFETSISRLEEIVRKFDDPDLTLDESLALYEEGVRLANSCRDTLDKAEQKLSVLDDADDR